MGISPLGDLGEAVEHDALNADQKKILKDRIVRMVGTVNTSHSSFRSSYARSQHLESLLSIYGDTIWINSDGSAVLPGELVSAIENGMTPLYRQQLISSSGVIKVFDVDIDLHCDGRVASVQSVTCDGFIVGTFLHLSADGYVIEYTETDLLSSGYVSVETDSDLTSDGYVILQPDNNLLSDGCVTIADKVAYCLGRGYVVLEDVDLQVTGKGYVIVYDLDTDVVSDGAVQVQDNDKAVTCDGTTIEEHDYSLVCSGLVSGVVW